MAYGPATHKERKSMKLNIPNVLTLLRFVITIAIVVLLSLPLTIEDIPTTGFNPIDLVCCLLFIIGAVSDALDGNIARKRNLVSDFGKFADPLADKALVNCSLIVLCATKGEYVSFILVVMMIFRDLAVDGLRFIASSSGEVIAANVYGKLKTVVQMIVIPILFLEGFPFNYLFKENTYILTNILLGIAVVFSWISGFIYLYRGRKYLGCKKNGN